MDQAADLTVDGPCVAIDDKDGLTGWRDQEGAKDP